MPWEKSFSREEAVTEAMHLFWQKGYEKTSISDICKVAGASRYGLYDEFGDKHAMYLKSLDYYSDYLVRQTLEPMEQPGAGLVELRTYRDTILASMENAAAIRGCFMCLAGAELAPKDAEVKARVVRHFARQRNAFLNCLGNVKTDLPATPEELADIILLTSQGVSILLRANCLEQAKQTFRSALSLVVLDS